MSDAKKNRIAILCAVLLTALLAALCRTLGLNGFLPKTMGILRCVLQCALIFAWATSVRQRILNHRVKSLLSAIAALLMFWLLIRSLKYLVFDGTELYYPIFWYLFYIPMEFIPLLGVFTALYIGKAEDYILPRKAGLLFLSTAAVVLMILTNTFHEFVFIDPELRSDYRYGAGYYIAAGWIALLAISFLLILFRRSRIPGRKMRLLLPFLPIMVGVLYTVAYCLWFDAIKPYAGDMTPVIAYLMVLTFEACIFTGLIPSNTRYRELAAVSTVMVEITDDALSTCYAADNMELADRSVLQQAVRSPVMLEGSIRLSSAPISGGYVFWREDVSAMLKIVEELQGTQEELKGYNTLLIEENKQKRRRKKLEEQEMLFRTMQEMTASCLSEIKQLSETLQVTTDLTRAKSILGRISILGAYIKRRSNLVFLSNAVSVIPAAELELCMKETLMSLRLYGVVGATRFEDGGEIDSQTAGTLYDLFESAVEHSLDTLTGVTVLASHSKMKLLLETEFDLSGLGFTREDGIWYCVRALGGAS